MVLSLLGRRACLTRPQAQTCIIPRPPQGRKKGKGWLLRHALLSSRKNLGHEDFRPPARNLNFRF